ncbi:MAG: 50S ribosomal protein L9 [Candidatus Omnitrophica bacterium]|nr:50S ribosomal protein L9 [Candidatus Omnitrophota bacterium]
MQVFLIESISKVGNAGEIVQVRDGYGRNFLLPRKLAVPVTEGTQKQVEEQRKMFTLASLRQEKQAAQLKEKIEQQVVQIPVRAGKDQKIFGSVTTQLIQKQLKEQGIRLDRKKIVLEQSIHQLGEYTVPVKLSSKVEAHIRIQVVQAVKAQ